ncbi:MAG: DUF1272 domain-containing protein [Candidatus Eremiobacteraeota bacterium]|nr:DUF1272 domain-containing protein [Candidatus Eremiobacteraeota bacterium]
MKSDCERCGRALRDAGAAWACSYGCTFCMECAAATEMRCPNCGGTLQPRSGLGHPGP